MVFSPRQILKSQCVLLTGGLGYEGSIVLEQLLRLTEVKAVYLLVRDKRNVPAAQRVKALLAGPLFNLLHAEAEAGGRNVFGKVVPVVGDLVKPGLGLSHHDLRQLRSNVALILHCGANIELDADVQKTLRNNYLGTWELMKAASQMEQLCGFVHVSTYFVNNHLPRNAVVRERIYPLALEVNGEPTSHGEYVAAMLAMSPEQANMHTADLMQRRGFTSTYAFGKHLTEQLVDGTVIRPGVSRAIVRPSLIASIAGDPYPGYIQSYAGAGGYSMGYALGYFQGKASVAYSSDTFLDLIPADTVASLIIAAGAAAAATCGSPFADRSAVIFHACSSQSHPLSLAGALERLYRFWRVNPPPLSLPATRYVRIKGEHVPTPQGVAAGHARAKLKLKLLGSMLLLLGKARELRALKMGLRSFSIHNSLRYNKSMVCAVDNVRALQGQLAPKEQQVWKVVFDEASMGSWDAYCFTFLAGVRRLLFRMESTTSKKLQHSFAFKPALSPDRHGILGPAPGGAVAGGPRLARRSNGTGGSSNGSRRSTSSVASGAAKATAAAEGEAAAVAAAAAATVAAPQEVAAAAAATEAAATVAAAALIMQGVVPPAAVVVAAAAAVAAASGAADGLISSGSAIPVAAANSAY